METYFKSPVLPKAPRAKFAKEGEILTGKVKGIDAKADEERFAKGLNRYPDVRQYFFRLAVGAPRGMPGWKELDFLIETFHGWVAVEVDDMEFVHKGKTSEMQMADLQRITGLKDIGVDVHEIHHVPAARLADEQGVDQVIRELL